MRAWSPQPSGGYAVTARFSRFKNLPELKALWQNVADIRVARGVPEMQRARPHMVDEEGQLSDRIYVMAPHASRPRGLHGGDPGAGK